ncbi:MAG: hypothetical protein QOJ75_1230 [Chloroflexota bacterium]|nr:hypothetical protein [Chloroflexota bacterium]
MSLVPPGARHVPAVGGTRAVPAPDPVARDYLLLALRLDQRIPGLVDGYFGPADLKAHVDIEQLLAPARLRDDAAALRARLPAEVGDPDRRSWLEVQLIALETQAAGLAGESLPYLESVARCFAFEPRRRPDAEFESAVAQIDALLPGEGPVAERLAAWDARFEVPVDRLAAILAWLVARFRARAASLFGLPEGEDLTVSLVTGQPWSGYNWFDGGRRSRVDINTDLPVHVEDLISTVAHETYPGHHLEHAWKEADLVDDQGRLESSVLLINTPECLISEGLANLGRRFAAPADDRADLLVELYERAGLAISTDRQAAQDAAERTAALAAARHALGAIRGNAAILRHADGWSHDGVVDYLVTVGHDSPATAAKRVEYIDHPLWRTYVLVYAEGEALLERWVDAVPVADRAARFGRLLHEQLTPASVRVPG